MSNPTRAELLKDLFVIEGMLRAAAKRAADAADAANDGAIRRAALELSQLQRVLHELEQELAGGQAPAESKAPESAARDARHMPEQ